MGLTVERTHRDPAGTPLDLNRSSPQDAARPACAKTGLIGARTRPRIANSHVTRLRKPVPYEALRLPWGELPLREVKMVNSLCHANHYDLAALQAEMGRRSIACHRMEKHCLWIDAIQIFSRFDAEDDSISSNHVEGSGRAASATSGQTRPSPTDVLVSPERVTQVNSALVNRQRASPELHVARYTKQDLDCFVFASGAVVLWGLRPQIHVKQGIDNESIMMRTVAPTSAGHSVDPPRTLAIESSRGSFTSSSSVSESSEVSPIRSVFARGQDSGPMATDDSPKSKQLFPGSMEKSGSNSILGDCAIRDMSATALTEVMHANKDWNSAAVGRVMLALEPFAGPKLRSEWQAGDTLHYTEGIRNTAHSKNRYAERISGDCIWLQTSDIQEKFAAALAMSQSVSLETYESAIIGTIASLRHAKWFGVRGQGQQMGSRYTRLGIMQKTRKAWQWLADKVVGAANMGPESAEMVKQIADLYVKIIDVNLVEKIVDVPEFFWDNGTWQSLWKAVHVYLEVKSRMVLLNTKCTYIKRLLIDVAHQRQEGQESELTWVCIFAIMAYIVVVIIRCFVDGGADV